MESKPSSRKPRHILELTHNEKLEFLDSFDVVLSDIDGVMWNFKQAIEGSGKGAKLLKKTGKKYIYVTNNSVRSDKEYSAKFKEIGIDIDMNEIIHPARSIVDYLKKNNFDGLIYCIASQIFKDYIKQAGYKVIDGPNEILEESISELAKNVFDKEPIKAVIIDVDFNMSAAKLIRAQQYLRRYPDMLFISGASDMLLPITNEIHIIGPGAFIKALEESSEKTSVVLGKPGIDLCEILIDRYNITNKERTLMIGDTLDQDISFANKCGFKSLLVLSGACRGLDSITQPEQMPNYYADSMGDFIKFFDSFNITLKL